jgi:hypothetical protein
LNILFFGVRVSFKTAKSSSLSSGASSTIGILLTFVKEREVGKEKRMVEKKEEWKEENVGRYRASCGV